MKTNGYALLALSAPRRNRRRTILGEAGDLISTLFSAGGEVTKKIVSNVQSQNAAEQGVKDSAAALAAVLAADQNATDANYAALISAELKTGSVAADQLAAVQANAAQDDAAAGLSPALQAKRSDAAKTALAKATSSWQAAAASKDPARAKAAELKVKANQMTYAKTQNAQIVKQGQGGALSSVSSGGNWLTRPVLGPVPGWGVAAGGVGLLGIAAVVIKKLVSR